MIPQLIKNNTFSNIYEIPLESYNPNFNFNISLSNKNFDIFFKTIKNQVFCSVMLDGVYLFNNANIKYDIVMNYTSLYYFSKGLFFFNSSKANIIPNYKYFGNYIKFYYGEL